MSRYPTVEDFKSSDCIYIYKDTWEQVVNEWKQHMEQIKYPANSTFHNSNHVKCAYITRCGAEDKALIELNIPEQKNLYDITRIHADDCPFVGLHDEEANDLSCLIEEAIDDIRTKYKLVNSPKLEPKSKPSEPVKVKKEKVVTGLWLTPTFIFCCSFYALGNTQVGAIVTSKSFLMIPVLFLIGFIVFTFLIKASMVLDNKN